MRLLVAVAYLSLAPVACGSEPPVPVGETRVLFASDFAIGLVTGRANGTTDEPSDVDDAFALSLALDHPTLDLRGIAVGFGNNRLLPEVATATAVTELLDLSVPVAAGAVQPLPLTPIVNSEGGTFQDDCVNDGVRLLATELQLDKAIVLGIAPSTDVACLVLNFPEAARNISELVILAGSRPSTSLEINGIELADFNFTMDPRALKVILDESKIPVTAIMFEVSSSSLLTTAQLTELRDSADPIRRWYGEASQAWAQLWTSQFAQDGIHPWDANTLWYVLHPEAFSCADVGYEIKAGVPSGDPSTDNRFKLSPDFTDTRTINGCDDYSSAEAKQSFIDAVFQSVHAP